MRKFFRGTYLGLLLTFLYAPIVVMIILSFNASKSRAKWGGFSLTWYERLFSRADIMNVLYMTLLIALIATAVATILGTLAAIGIHAMKSRNANMIMSVSYLPMTTPDIVTGVSLMLMFVFIRVPLGYRHDAPGHIAFDTPLRPLFGAAKTQADEREPLRGGAGPGLHADAGGAAGDPAGDHAGRGDGRALGVHDVAG